MNKKYFGINSKYLIAIIFILSSTFKLDAQLVTNGSFENSEVGAIDTTVIEGWVLELLDGAVAQFYIDTTEAIDGNKSFKAVVDTLGANDWSIQAIIDSIPVTKGNTYKYSIWAKADNPGARVNFTIGYYNYSELGAIRPAELTTEWKEFTMQFTVIDDETYVRGPIHFNFSGDIGNAVYIDNAKIEDVNKGKKPIIVEAESGEVGSNFSILDDGDISYITTTSNNTSVAAPLDTNRMITYEVTFEDSGYYSLFAHVRVGSGGFDDDSFFYARGFGEKSDTAGSDWVFINGLGSAGFEDSTAIVDGPGSLGSGIWKWINVTKNTYSGVAGDTFYVSPDSLTKTFQIASREDGLDIDKIAFGKTYLYYTVDILNKGLNGLDEPPVIDDGTVWEGPALAFGDARFVGNADDNPNDTYVNYWNQITPENAGKWASVGTSSDTTQWNWGGIDRVYNFAKENNIPFKFHTLIWGAQQPNWISNSGLDPAQQLAYIETWIRQVGLRYPDMEMVDVVNEPLLNHNPPDGTNNRANYKEALGGNGDTGWDWVIKSFELARKYIPNAKLILNEYGIINSSPATTSYLTIINLLNERGLIDGIGVQGHRFELESAAVSTLKSNLDRLAATGLPIYISEFDLGNLSNSGAPNDDKQLELYKKIFPVLWEHPGVEGITLWGYIEDQIWQETCYLVRATGSARPALLWLAEYIQNNPTGISESEYEVIASSYKLEQNYPNPFNPSTQISFSIPEFAKVKLEVFDLLGRKLKTLLNEEKPAGFYTVEFNAEKLSSGTYFYRLSTANHVEVKHMLLLK